MLRMKELSDFKLFLLLVFIICEVSAKLHWIDGHVEYSKNSQIIQDIIYKHQNPVNCSGKQFLVPLYWDHGVGSVLHVYASNLGIAMDSDSILIYDYKTRPMWTKDIRCESFRYTPECFFKPISRCQSLFHHLTIDEIYNGTVPHSRFINSIEGNFRQYNLVNIKKYMRNIQGSEYIQNEIQQRTWWRVQCTNYLMRFKNKFIQECKQYISTNLKVLYPDKDTYENITAVDLPLNSIGIHIRGRDKANEMQLKGFEKYIKGAESLVNEYDLSKNIFFASDEQNHYENFEKNKNLRRGFTFYYVPFREISRWADGVQYTEMIDFFSIILLLSQKRIAGLVVTTASNVDRLILERILITDRPIQIVDLEATDGNQ